MQKLYIDFFYRHSIFEMLFWGVLLIGVWIMLAVLLRKYQRVWWTVNLILLLMISIFIVDRTLLGRESKREIQLIPFYSLVVALKTPERIRYDVTNMLLFLPMGLSMPFVLELKKEKLNKRIVKITIITAMLFSLSIESLQYIFSRGLCETDDIIFNTLGAAFGTYAFVAVQRMGDMSAKRAIGKGIYLGIAVHMPQNGRTFNFGAKKLRAFLTRLIIKQCGKDVWVDKGADFTDDLVIGNNSNIGINCKLQSGVTIGNNVTIDRDCLFYTQTQNVGTSNIPMEKQKFEDNNPIIIGNDVYIGARTIILPGVNVGDGAIIGAGSIVSHDVEPYTVVAGNPAKIIRKR